MIPVALRLCNFMSYGEDVPPVDFTQFRIACLSGDNGHGKSALLDAITWALWGRSRARTDDELIHLGRLDMEVEFTFDLGDERYRVLRKRAIRATAARRTLTGALDLQVYDPTAGVFRSMSADTQPRTQGEITRLLRMDYETFINSAFLLQGRSDEFTLKQPADRKRILAEVLGLAYYDEIEARARERAREIEAERRQTQASIAEADREVDQIPVYERDVAAARERAERLEEVTRLQAELLTSLKSRLDELERKRKHLVGTRARHDDAVAALDELASQRDALRGSIEEYEALLARASEIQQNLDRLQELRQREAQLTQRAARARRLEVERRRHEQIVQAVLAELRGEEGRLKGRLDELARQTRALDPASQALARAEAELASLVQVEAERDRSRDAIQALDVEAAGLGPTKDRLRQEMDEIKRRLDLLERAEATCPVCGQTLGPEERDRLTRELNEQGRARGDEFRTHQARLRAIADELDGAKKGLAELERRLAGQAAVRAEESRRRVEVEAAVRAAEQMAEADAEWHAVKKKLDRREYAVEARANLQDVVRAIEAEAYDEKEHGEVRAAVERLAPAETQQARLMGATEQVATMRRQLAFVESQLAARQEDVTAVAREVEELVHALAGDAALRREQQEKLNEHENSIKQRALAGEQHGIALQKINHAREVAARRQERVAEIGRLAEEKSLYDELAVAFGRRGIQAMIIETSIPEIERDANELLGRMTDGRLALTFETQRATRAGDGTIETLDIRVTDEWGARAYEMYSGGEAFRIDLAIRIALSKLLARRAGARLQTLVIDEGFGSQDAAGRDRIVETINAVGADFEKVIVVTHIADLKDAFPARIEVIKDEQGSRVHVA